ncbi:MAG: alpha/beta hydrolase-fold protein [Ekhidna sp.]
MKKTLLTVLITTILTALIVLTVFEVIAQQRQIEADALVEIDSEILNEKRNILIHLPYAYDPDEVYPVLYVLDGSSQDFRMAGIAEVLNMAGTVPEMIIVGIPNTNRNRDLTPHYILQETDGEIYGEGDHFLSFITDEVAPYIEGRYPTNGYKMLAGHSRGGLFSFYAYLERPNSFDAYFSFSPAFWRDESLAVKKAEKELSYSSTGNFIFLSLGTEENDKMKAGYDAMIRLMNTGTIESYHHMYTPNANHGNNLFYSTPKALQLWAESYAKSQSQDHEK